LILEAGAERKWKPPPPGTIRPSTGLAKG